MIKWRGFSLVLGCLEARSYDKVMLHHTFSFSIDIDTGLVPFNTPPVVENPQDSGANNI